MFFGSRKKETSFILNTQFLNGVGSGAVRTFTFWQTVYIHNIWLTSTTTAAGIYTFNFRTLSTTNNPYVQSSSDPYSLKKIVVNSWLAGVMNYEFKKPIESDYLEIVNTTAVAVGAAINVMIEIEIK